MTLLSAILLIMCTNPNVLMIENRKFMICTNRIHPIDTYQIYLIGPWRYISDISNTSHKIYIRYDLKTSRQQPPCQLDIFPPSPLTESLASLSPVAVPCFRMNLQNLLTITGPDLFLPSNLPGSCNADRLVWQE